LLTLGEQYESLRFAQDDRGKGLLRQSLRSFLAMTGRKSRFAQDDSGDKIKKTRAFNDETQMANDEKMTNGQNSNLKSQISK